MSDHPLLLMTRPRVASERFLAELAGDGITGFRAIFSPLFDIVLKGVLPDLSEIQALIFTSANGVDSYISHGGRTDLPCYIVGPATAKAASAHGITAQNCAEHVDGLFTLLCKLRPAGQLLHVHGTHVTGDLANDLTQVGIATRAARLYDQPARPLNKAALEALDSKVPVIIPLFSPRSGRLLSCTPTKGRSILVAAISEMVAKSVRPLHIQDMQVAEAPNSASLRVCVAQLLHKARLRLDEPDEYGFQGAQAFKRIER